MLTSVPRSELVPLDLDPIGSIAEPRCSWHAPVHAKFRSKSPRQTPDGDQEKPLFVPIEEGLFPCVHVVNLVTSKVHQRQGDPMGATPVSERRRYDLYDGDTWYGVKHMTDAGVAVMQRHGYRVTAVAEEGEAQPDVELTSAAVQKALADPIDVPHECICAYIRVMPYGLVQRHANPDCTEHSPDEPDGELEKERD